MVWRSYSIIGLALILSTSVACERKSHKTRITKGKALSKVTQKNGPCLNLKKLTDLIKAQPQADFTVHTEDVDYGSLQTPQAKKQTLIFTSQGDASVRAGVALKSKLKPKLLSLKAQSLQTTAGVAELLDVVEQNQCAEVKFRRGQNVERFRVIDHTAGNLTLQSQTTGEVLEYIPRGTIGVTITRFFIEDLSVCGKPLPAGGVLKETLTIGSSEALNQVTLKRDYAETLTKHLNSVPSEVSQALLTGGPDVTIPLQAFSLLISLVEREQLKNLNCN